MLSRRIHRQQLKRLIPLGNELVLRSRGNNDHVAGFDFLVFAVDCCEAPAGCEEEDLVDEMDLLAVFNINKHIHVF